MKKKIAALLCVGLMIGTFAGCNNSQPSGNESGSPAPEPMNTAS